MHYFLSFTLILCSVTIPVKTTNFTSAFSASVFIFFDDGNRLSLNNEITTLKFWCSGCILSSKLILTTASCFNTTKIYAESLIVVPTEGARVFEDSINKKSYEVDSIIVGPEEKISLALLLLKQDVIFSNNINKVHMPSYAIKSGMKCTSLLWMREPSPKSASVIFKSNIVSGEIDMDCIEKYGNQYEFCFIFNVDEDSCYDVQGSILTCNDILQGISSSKYGGADPYCPNPKNSSFLNVFYINLKKFETWIHGHVRTTMNEIAQSKKEGEEWFEYYNKSNNGRFSKLIQLILFFLILSL